MDILLSVDVQFIRLEVGYTRYTKKNMCLVGFILNKLGQTFISNLNLGLLEGL